MFDFSRFLGLETFQKSHLSKKGGIRRLQPASPLPPTPRPDGRPEKRESSFANSRRSRPPPDFRNRGAVLVGGLWADAGRAQLAIIRFPAGATRPPWPAPPGCPAEEHPLHALPRFDAGPRPWRHPLYSRKRCRGYGDRRGIVWLKPTLLLLHFPTCQPINPARIEFASRLSKKRLLLREPFNLTKPSDACGNWKNGDLRDTRRQ